MLNRYFGPMCDAVEASGGEVLKFIGDSVLAIFPIELERLPPAAAHLRRRMRRGSPSKRKTFFEPLPERPKSITVSRCTSAT